jgi:hypothetical protein
MTPPTLDSNGFVRPVLGLAITLLLSLLGAWGKGVTDDINTLKRDVAGTQIMFAEINQKLDLLLKSHNLHYRDAKAEGVSDASAGEGR